MVRIPPALAAKSPKRSSGLTQITRRLDLASRSDLGSELIEVVALEPVRDEERDRALAEHAPRPIPVETVQRLADPRAAGPIDRHRRTPRQRVVGIAGVHRAGHVGQTGAEQKCRHAPGFPKACRKCRKRRVYSFIEPEMSHKRRPAGRDRRPSETRGRSRPALQRTAETSRASIRAGRPPGAKRRVRRLSSGMTSRLIALRASSSPRRSSGRNPSIARSPSRHAQARRRVRSRDWLGRS